MKQTERKNLYLTALLSLIFILSGCSSGGSDSDSKDTPSPQPNRAPIVTKSDFVQSVREGMPVAFGVASLFRDPDGDTLNYSASAMPEWLELDPDTGNVTGTVALDACAKQCSYEMQVKADDGRGGTVDTNITVMVTAVFKEGGWFGRTTVNATASDGKVYRHSTAGIFGELKQSSDGKDHHDIPGYGTAILKLVFQPDFTKDREVGYFSDYRYFDGDTAAKQSWYFEVKNQHTVNLADRPFTLSLAQLKRVEYKNVEGYITYKETPMSDDIVKSQLHLLDLDHSCARFTPGDLSSTTFEMKDVNGTGVHTRHFRWVFGAPDENDCNIPIQPNTSSRSLQSAVSANDFEPAPKTGSKFGLPPM